MVRMIHTLLTQRRPKHHGILRGLRLAFRVRDRKRRPTVVDATMRIKRAMRLLNTGKLERSMEGQGTGSNLEGEFTLTAESGVFQ